MDIHNILTSVLKPNLSVSQVEASVDSPTCLDFRSLFLSCVTLFELLFLKNPAHKSLGGVIAENRPKHRI